MSDKTGIEWTEATWNPVTGCAKVSAGCKHCYAERDWNRLQHLPAYAGRAFTDVATHTDRLVQPLRWARPRRIFVNSMSDLFHEAVHDDFIDLVFAVISVADRHTFQILTKRADRMQRYMATPDRLKMIRLASLWLHGDVDELAAVPEWPPRNAHLGVSVEDQAAADERIPLLLQTPAAVRWISAEPLLGPVNLAPKADKTYQMLSEWYGQKGFDPTGSQPRRDRMSGYFPRIDWVVVGGESGPKARPMHPQWARDLRDQCQAAGVPFLFKQWGEWIDDDNIDSANLRTPKIADPNEHFHECGWGDGTSSWRVGKKAAGRLIDGVQHDGYPTKAEVKS